MTWNCSETPWALFDDSLSPPGGACSRLFSGHTATLTCATVPELEAAFAAIEAARAQGLWVVVLASYELGYLLEPAILRHPYPGSEPLLTAHVFRSMAALTRAATDAWLAARLAELSEDERFCGVANLQPGLDESAYVARVQRIRRYITEGDCYQVNFTYPLHLRHYGHPLALYARLRQRQPVQYGAYIEMPQQAVLSLSPELFVRRRGSRLTSKPMKGTAPRGTSAEEDSAGRARLAASAKDRAENVMIVDLIRNDLGRLARPGSVQAERLFQIEAYPTVWQMTSTVSAETPGATLAQVFRALFPCGSVTGAPKIRAMQIIAELEQEPRGLYTGAAGWVAPDGNFVFNVAIRTLVLEADGRGRLGIGGGIVFDSDPADELAECGWKARFLTGIEAGFELIETLAWDPAEVAGYPYLELHLQRLQASARYFGFRCDEAQVRRALAQHAHGFAPRQRYRVRLLLAQDGRLGLASSPFASDPRPAKVELSRLTVDSRDLFLYHKTTRRPRFDAELARIAQHPGCFDVLFCNERGELTEGARSNLFLAFGNALHTPPVSAGLLNGVMRRHLLARQDPPVVERTLYPADLRRADAIYVANALRGLLRVELAEDAAASIPAHNPSVG